MLIGCPHLDIILLNRRQKVYSVGYNRFCELRIGNNINSIEIKEIEFPCLVDKNKEIINIFSGLKHSFAISKNNEIYCWGRNFEGELGNIVYQ